MRLLISGGGSGGHVYPALAVVAALSQPQPAGIEAGISPSLKLLWIGSQGGLEESLLSQAGIEFVGLASGGLRGKGLRETVTNTLRIGGSIQPAWHWIARFKPDVILVTGGYTCVAVTLAARLQRVPVLIYLPDIVPGKAIQLLSRIAARVAVTSEESRQYLPRAKVVVTGYPVRPELYSLDRGQARRDLGLDSDADTLLVFGGSQGARSINKALVAGLGDLLPVCQVIHVSGRLDADWVAAAAQEMPEEMRKRYHHYPYLHDMPRALVAADLAVARAGAGTLGEFPAAGLPAIVVPYPYSGQHQLPNAMALERRGAARMLPDSQLAAELVRTVLQLLGDKPELAKMRQSARALARPDAAEAIARQICLLAGQPGTVSKGVNR